MAAFLRPSYHLYHLFWAGVDWLYPPRCGGCAQHGARWCSDCQAAIQTPAAPLCLVCGEPQTSTGPCVRCRRRPPAYTAARSWGVFTGPLQQAVHAMKYRRDLGLGEALAHPLAALLARLGWEADLVVPVPLGAARRAERGYNQVAMLAFPLALKAGKPYQPRALTRVRETESQVGLDLSQRSDNVKGAFRATEFLVSGRSVLLVDDVMTTGATLHAAATALASAGARQVYALTLARAVLAP